MSDDRKSRLSRLNKLIKELSDDSLLKMMEHAQELIIFQKQQEIAEAQKKLDESRRLTADYFGTSQPESSPPPAALTASVPEPEIWAEITREEQSGDYTLSIAGQGIRLSDQHMYDLVQKVHAASDEESCMNTLFEWLFNYEQDFLKNAGNETNAVLWLQEIRRAILTDFSLS